MTIPSIVDPERLIDLAAEIFGRVAERYRSAAEQARVAGRLDLARIFRDLVAEEDSHLALLAKQPEASSPRRAVPPEVLDAVESLLPHLDLAELTHARPYFALAEAVREKDRCFRLFCFVSAQSEDSRVQDLAESLAKEQLQSAHRLRQARRKAYRKSGGVRNRWPGPSKIDDIETLISAARSGEAAFLRTVEDQIGAEPLAGTLAKITHEGLSGLPARSAAPAGKPESEPLEAVLDHALAAFGFYDAVASGAVDSDVLDRAQALSEMALARIETICAANRDDQPPRFT